MSILERDLRTSQRQGHLARFGRARHAELLAGTDGGQSPRHLGSRTLQLPDMVQLLEAEDPQSLTVGLIDAARIIDGNQPRLGALHDELVVTLALLGPQLGPREDLLDAVERRVEHGIVDFRRVLVEAEREVVVLDGVEHEGNAPHRVAVTAQDPHEGNPHQRDADQQQRIEPMRYEPSAGESRRSQHTRMGDHRPVCNAFGKFHNP